MLLVADAKIIALYCACRLSLCHFAGVNGQTVNDDAVETPTDLNEQDGLGCIFFFCFIPWSLES